MSQKVGVFCSSNNPSMWPGLYMSLTHNKIDFNICVVGPTSPPTSTSYNLPPNFKYIQSNVKPVQCCFIAANNTEGDYIINVPDDARLSPGYLDKTYSVVNGQKNVVASGRYTAYLERWMLECFLIYSENLFGWNKKGEQYVIRMDSTIPVMPMIHRETFFDIGVDKNYIAAFWDIDIAFELKSRGGRSVLVEDVFVDEIVISDNSLSYYSRDIGDYAFLTNLWFYADNGKIRQYDKRRIPIEPMEYNTDVLKVSQGKNCSKWD